MTGEPRPGGGRAKGVAALLLVVVGVFVCCGLGVWQVQRLHWKEGVLARIAQLQVSPPEPLAVVLRRRAEGRDVDFVRVAGACQAFSDRTVYLYGSRSAGPGWRHITACALGPGSPYGSLLVDLGFQTDSPTGRPTPEPVTLQPGEILTGVLRSPGAKPWFTPETGGGGEGTYLWRNLPAMAAQLKALRPAPLFLMLESPKPGPDLIPTALPTDLPNNHLGYAITWFGLGAAMAATYAASLIAQRRKRR